MLLKNIFTFSHIIFTNKIFQLSYIHLLWPYAFFMNQSKILHFKWQIWKRCSNLNQNALDFYDDDKWQYHDKREAI